MVKKRANDATAADSDADNVEEWMEQAAVRMSAPRGKYKTYRGVPC